MSFGRGIFAAVLISAATFFCSFRQQPTTSEDFKLKAVFLYNFSKYVKWKDITSDEPIQIAVISDNTAFYSEVKRLFEGRKNNNRPYVCEKVSDLESSVSHDILFVDRGIVDMKKAHQLATANNILLVTNEEEGSLSMINFIRTEEDKLKFDVNTKNLKAASVELDQELIRLANKVIE